MASGAEGDESAIPGGRFAERKLSLQGLPAWTRRLALACIGAWTLSSALVVMDALSVELPLGEVLIPEFAPVPHLTVIAVDISLVLAAAALCAALTHSGRAMEWPLRIALATVGLAVASQGVEFGEALDSVLGDDGDGLIAGWAPEAVIALSWIGVVGATGGALPLAAFGGRRWAAPMLATVPFLAALLSYALIAATEDIQLAPGQTTDGLLLPSGYGAGISVIVVISIGFLLSILILWQRVAGARASRDAAVEAGRAVANAPIIFGALLAAKLLWLTFGLAGALPGLFGGDSEAWDATLEDGLVSWIAAAMIAAAAIAWLSRGRPYKAKDSDVTRPASAIIAGLTLAFAISSLCLLLIGGLGLLDADEAVQAVADLGSWAADRLLLTTVLTTYLAGVGAVVLWRRGVRVPAAVLGLYFAWTAPRATHIAISGGEDLGDHATLSRIELTTIDTALTIILALVFGLLAVGRLRDAQISAAAGAIALVGSTVLAWSGQLATSVWDEEAAFYIALIFPVAYQLLLGSRETNEDETGRVSRVLLVTGSAAGVLAIIAVQIQVGFAGPGILGTGSLGRDLISLPLFAVLIGAACSAPWAKPGAIRPTPRAPAATPLGRRDT